MTKKTNIGNMTVRSIRGCQSMGWLVTAASILLFIAATSCKESTDENEVVDDDSISYGTKIEGQEMDADWCMETQLQLASLEGSPVGRDQIDETLCASYIDFSGTRSDIKPEEGKPIKILGWSSYMNLPEESSWGARVPKEIHCKFRTQDSIESLLEVNIDGEEGTCKEMNQRALDWALGRLTKSQRSRYDSLGKKLVFVDDNVAAIGSGWIGADITYTENGDTVEVMAPAMVILHNDPTVDTSEGHQFYGVHYCKLLSPTQVMFWLVERAFWDDPTGDGPEGSGFSDAELVATEQGGDCRLPEPTIAGSCYFYFSISKSWFCNDFTGKTWNLDKAAAIEKCASKEEGEYFWSDGPCSEREDETGGPTLGECVISCGDDDEQRWNVYGIPEGYDDVESACPMDWFPVED